jgi:hypothetical protein
MPVPLFSEGKHLDGLYRTYTNSILIVNKGQKTALVPRHKNLNGSPYPDDDLLEGYEKEVVRVFNQVGYKVVFLNADQLVQFYGALRCISQQI